MRVCVRIYIYISRYEQRKKELNVINKSIWSKRYLENSVLSQVFHEARFMEHPLDSISCYPIRLTYDTRSIYLRVRSMLLLFTPPTRHHTIVFED